MRFTEEEIERQRIADELHERRQEFEEEIGTLEEARATIERQKATLARVRDLAHDSADFIEAKAHHLPVHDQIAAGSLASALKEALQDIAPETTEEPPVRSAKEAAEHMRFDSRKVEEELKRRLEE